MPIRLEDLRKRNLLRQKDIAKLLGITAATYNRYEQGIICPSVEKLILIADFYQVTLDYLLMRTDEESFIVKKENKEDILVCKYNLLDSRGKSSVNAVLEHEYRIVDEQTKRERRSRIAALSKTLL